MVDADRASPKSSVARLARSFALGAAVGYAATTLVILALGVLLTHVLLPGTVGAWDGHASAWLARHRTPWLDDVTADLTKVANTSGVVVVAIAVEIVLLLRRHARAACVVVVGLAVELASFLTVNALIARPRPHVPKLDSVPTTTSFPSGHIAATLTLYVLIALCVVHFSRSTAWHRVAWVVAVVLPVLVGFARVYRGMHHVTDVLAGVLLGIGSVTTGLVVVQPWHDEVRRELPEPFEPEPVEVHRGVRAHAQAGRGRG
jgi:membrane-associated phospholipid phosphatase